MNQPRSDRRATSPAFRQRTIRLLASIALPTMLLGAALPAAANSVSNLELDAQEGDGIIDRPEYPHAQGFTSGGNGTGYTLQSITLRLKSYLSNPQPTHPTVALYSEASVDPSSLLATLSAPSGNVGTGWGNYTYTCSTGCNLDEVTTYYVVVWFATQQANGIYWAENSDNSETNTPASSGWRIADKSWWRNGEGGIWVDNDESRLISVSYTPEPDLWVENITWGTADLYLHNWTGVDWSAKVTGTGVSDCIEIRKPFFDQVDLRGQPSTQFTVTAHSGRGCDNANLLDTETFTTRARSWKRPALSATSIGTTTATLDLANHAGDWWYVETLDPSTCNKVDSGTSSVDLTGLTENTSYQYYAYGTAGCGNATTPVDWVTDQLNFVTSGSITVTVTNANDTSANLAITGLSSGKWSYQHVHSANNEPQYSACTTNEYSETSVVVPNLTAGTFYVFYVYRGASCTFNEWITTEIHTFELSAGQVGSTSAKLTLENYGGAWHHKQVGGSGGASSIALKSMPTTASANAGGSCSDAVSGGTADLSGLTPETDYTWKAYKAAGCADADAIATATFTTLAAGQSPPNEETTPPPVTGGGGGGSGGGSSRTPEVRPQVSALAVTSDPGSDFRYELGDEILIEATFSETVRTLSDNVALALTVGGEVRSAGYVGGSGTETLRFRYTVEAEDKDFNGIGIAADALKDNFGRIHSLGGLASPLDIDAGALPDTALHRVGPPPSVPLLPAADDLGRQGFVRVINHSDAAGEVSITAIDDAGTRFGPVTLAIGANAAAHFNAADLERGNAAKGLTGGTGPGAGNWRLELDSALVVEALGYLRHGDGFLTALGDVAPRRDGAPWVATFNPASNHRQASWLRLVNQGADTASVRVSGVDDSGRSPGGAVEMALAAGAAERCDAQALELGGGASPGLGDGAGKWRLTAEAGHGVEAMGLLESPSGHLTNLSTAPTVRHGDALVVPLFPSASDPHGRQGVLRIINQSDERGDVYIKAYDDSEWDYRSLSLTIEANAAVHLNSDDLELGNADKGLRGRTGAASAGDWRLRITTDLDVEALAYVRHSDGFLTSMHDVAPEGGGTHRVATFNPASNERQASLLRIVNLGNEAAKVSIKGIDGAGESPGTDVTAEVPANSSLTLTAAQLEQGGEGLKGALGDGASKWRLHVSSEQDILVMSLLQSPGGHLSNLSSRPHRPD